MEFKLNKIDTDIRNKMQEEVKEDKVHSAKSISIKKDIKDEKKENAESADKELEKRRYITIDGVKYNNKNVDIQAEKIQEINEANSKGRILDTTK